MLFEKRKMPPRSRQWQWAELVRERTDMLDTYVYNMWGVPNGASPITRKTIDEAIALYEKISSKDPTMTSKLQPVYEVNHEGTKNFLESCTPNAWVQFPYVVGGYQALAYYGPSYRTLEIRIPDHASKVVHVHSLTTQYIAEYTPYCSPTGNLMPLVFATLPSDTAYQWFCNEWDHQHDPSTLRHQQVSFLGETHREPHQDENGMINGRFL